MPAKKQTFEEALGQLDAIVTQLERADVPLEEALKQFQEGIKLSQYCKKILDQAEKTVTTLMLENGDSQVLEELEQ